MNWLNVVAHTSADYLGLLEDHLEGRRIGFRYFRPFTEDGGLPGPADSCDGLILLGGGPWGSAGGRDVPTLQAEIELVREMMRQERAVIGIGLGAQIVCRAAGGSSEPAPLSFEAGYARRVRDDALAGFMPGRFPLPFYMRDLPRPPAHADILAVYDDGRPAVFQVGPKVLGFTGHPGFKTAMAEDLVMEFEEAPEDPAAELQKLQGMMREIEDALVPLMTGIVQQTGLMRSKRRIPLKVT
jgi:GMP synthase-like glutamine amidotransferase